MSENDSAASLDAAALAAFVPLSGLSHEYLSELAGGAMVAGAPAGHELLGDERSRALTWYLLAGELALKRRDGGEGSLVAGTPQARFALPTPAEGFGSVRARTDIRLLGVNRAQVSKLLVLAQAPRAPGSAGHPDAWVIRLLRTDLFSRVPAANVQRVFERMEPVDCAAGQIVLEQGSPANHYYVVRNGTFEVSHRTGPDTPTVEVARLGPGDTFGEEALVSGAERNATVRALETGTVMRMTRDAFVELIQEPALDTVDRARAEDLVRTGAAWIDVRLPEEHARNGLEGSLNFPLSAVRHAAAGLDRERAYVVYSNTARRSAAAALVLTELGLRASVLAGGLDERPWGEATPIGEAAHGIREELLEVNQVLEEALRKKAEVEATRRVELAPAKGDATEEAQAALKERQRQLEEASIRATEALGQARRRKLELEERLRDTEAQAVSLRSRAQEQIEQIRAQAEERLRAEEARLHTEFSQAADQMKQLEAAQAQAEERFRAERERLEAELAEARARMEREAARIRKEMEEAKRGAQQRATAIQSQQATAETRLREETEARLREERRRLESEFATSLEAQEKAKQDLQSAEGAIAEAQAEAERLAARLQAEREAREEAERKRQEAERQRLARERERAAAELAAAERAKLEAERKLESTIRRGDEEKTAEQVKSVEAKVAKASEAVETAKAAKAEADEAQVRAEARIAAQRELEEELRLQLIEEAEMWLLDERHRSESDLEQARVEAERLAEVDARKAESKRRDRAADDTLIADVSLQLGDESSDGLDVIEESLAQREYAAEKAALAKRAQEEATAERMRAEQALEQARRRMAKD